MNSSFKALLAQATRDTTKSQLELSNSLKQRQLAQQEAERISLQNERQRQIEIEQRRQERMDRERKEQEDKSLRPLPRTRNLTELKVERRKRGLDEHGKDDWMLNKGERGQHQGKPSTSHDPPTLQAKVPGQSLKQLMAAASKIPPSAMRTNPKASTSTSKSVLTNEQKLAKKRDALFSEDEDQGLETGSVALARQRGLHEPTPKLRERSSISPIRSAPSTLTLMRAKTTSQIIRAQSNGSASSGKRSPRPSTNMTSSLSSHYARTIMRKGGQSVPGFDPSQFVKLNTEKRDTRTIEEIERDMKLRKAGKSTTLVEGRDDKGKSTGGSGSGKKADSVQGTTMGSKRKIVEGSLTKKPRVSTSTSTSHQNGRRRSERSSSETDSGSSSSTDDRHRHRSKPSTCKPHKKSGLDDSVRSEIWRLMGRDRSKDLAQPLDLSDSEEEGMEVDGEELEREERRAERISRLEEREEEERERRRKEDKERKRRKKG
ncbi:BQ2448_5102 [Microbotryum intermedium]|uniref:BQ2448_5102 protein n=1 Tax=Microbotryum intermedium TaxID=269621 RepID=A0A238F638_9BASI|nr:BQ2448_5102 [Microbotryum intermedium]